MAGATVYPVDVTEVTGNTATTGAVGQFEDNAGTPGFSLVWDLVERGVWKLDVIADGDQTNWSTWHAAGSKALGDAFRLRWFLEDVTHPRRRVHSSVHPCRQGSCTEH